MFGAVLAEAAGAVSSVTAIATAKVSAEDTPQRRAALGGRLRGERPRLGMAFPSWVLLTSRDISRRDPTVQIVVRATARRVDYWGCGAPPRRMSWLFAHS